MRWEILDAPRIQLLKALVETPEIDGFYLAGGTALSLQLGLRRSFDFDFFTERRFNADALLDAIRSRWQGVQVNHLDSDTCDVIIDGVQVSFMRYPYPLIESLVSGDDALPRLKLCAAEDIAVMKLSAIGRRGARKDFYDLYQIYRRVPGFDSQKLMRCAHLKFGERFDLTYMIAGMSYFVSAEDEVLPKTFVPADWNDIKDFFRREQTALFALEAERY